MQVFVVKTRVKHLPAADHGWDRMIAPLKPCKDSGVLGSVTGAMHNFKRSMTREYGVGEDVNALTSMVIGSNPSAQTCRWVSLTLV